MRYLLSLICCFISTAYGQNQNTQAITVVELFTSQGCYSCPPADSLLGTLKQRENVIALSCHVTYWNYLGWKDTFSNAFCDKRQRGYQSHLQGNPGNYTPQMVVNGQYGLVGSRSIKVNKLLSILSKKATIAPIALSLLDNEKITIALPAVSSGKQQLFLLGTSGEHDLPITRGENGGKTLHYHNPIERVIDLGNWDGTTTSLTQAISQKSEASTIKEWVVIAQQWPLGEITAAGKVIVQSEKIATL